MSYKWNMDEAVEELSDESLQYFFRTWRKHDYITSRAIMTYSTEEWYGRLLEIVTEMNRRGLRVE